MQILMPAVMGTLSLESNAVDKGLGSICGHLNLLVLSSTKAETLPFKVSINFSFVTALPRMYPSSTVETNNG
jgi:hypothetical protein